MKGLIMSSKQIRVGAFQFPAQANIIENKNQIIRAMKEAAHSGVRLLLTQECALCGYPPIERKDLSDINQHELLDAMKEISFTARDLDLFIALGSIEIQEDRAFNVVHMISPQGDIIETYGKRALWGWDVDHFKRGESKGVVEIDGIKIGMRICFEVRFPELFRELYAEHVDVCLVSFADVGPIEQKTKMEVIQSHLISRASENIMYVVSANSTSDYQLAPTCFIDPNGYMIQKAKEDEVALIYGDLLIETPSFGQKGRIVNTDYFRTFKA